MYRASLTLSAQFEEPDIEILSGALYDISDAVVAFREGNEPTGDWIVEWIMPQQPDASDLTARVSLVTTIEGLTGFSITAQDWQIAAVANENWLEKSYKGFPPFSVGPFFIHGSHYDGAVPDEAHTLQIDAATAFGSGEHETTKGCLQGLLELDSQGVCPWNVLDMGTGSGILAIAAYHLWKTPIFASDIEEEAIRVTRRHLAANGVSEDPAGITCAAGDGFAAPGVKERAPFDLIMANILAGPLIEMSQDLCGALDENGFVILSGMLTEQSDHVLSAYEAHDLALKHRYDIGEWSTLVLQKTA